MISRKDVIRMRIAYPNMQSKLAKVGHMYICYDESYPAYSFVKCQTYTIKNIDKKVVKHYVYEQPDIKRNPFKWETLIDCDKLFCSSSSNYDEKLRTDSRPDVAEAVMQNISEELTTDGCQVITLDEKRLVLLNKFITCIPKK